MKLFSVVQNLGSLIVLTVMIVVWGLPAAPALLFFQWASEAVTSEPSWIEASMTALLLSTSAVIYMISMLVLSASLQFLFTIRIKEKKVVPLQSMTTVRWAFCGQIGRCTRPVLQHFAPSVLANLYYKACGARVGSGAQINTPNLNDPNLISIGKNVVIGGAATLNGHLVERGELVLSPITIGDNALIGTGVMIQPGVQIGEGAVIASRAVVPKYKVIPAGEVWGGIPAVKIKDSSHR